MDAADTAAPHASGGSLAGDVIAAARVAGVTLGCAESLTGGALCASLVDVPGASVAVRGAVVAYQLEVKTLRLAVPAALLADEGPVSERVAAAMAEGVRGALRADVGIATTGAAGPEPHGGRPAGTVCLAVAHPGGTVSATVMIDGDRARVRAGAVEAALALTLEVLAAP